MSYSHICPLNIRLLSAAITGNRGKHLTWLCPPVTILLGDICRTVSWLWVFACANTTAYFHKKRKYCLMHPVIKNSFICLLFACKTSLFNCISGLLRRQIPLSLWDTSLYSHLHHDYHLQAHTRLKCHSFHNC